MQTNTLYLVDAHAFLHRSFHAMPSLTTPSGEEVGALYGFVKLLAGIIRNIQPEFVGVCFDSKGGSTLRREMYPEYKANRPPIDPALLKQLVVAREASTALGLNAIFADGWEADDIMATLARRANAQGIRTVIVSGDKDVCQLISPSILAWDGSSPDLRDEQYVIRRYGIPPALFADYLALLGDSSDNVPGVVGIGEKSATRILQKYGSLSNAIEATQSEALLAGDKLLQKLAKDTENARLSKKLVSLDKDAPVDIILDSLRPKGFETPEFDSFVEKYQFKILDSLRSTHKIAEKTVRFVDFADILSKIDKKISISYESGSISLSLDDEAAILYSISEVERQKILDILSDSGIRKNIYALKNILSMLSAPEYFAPVNFFDCQAAERMLFFQANPRSLSELACYVYSLMPKNEEKEKISQGIAYFDMLYDDLAKRIADTGQKKLFEETEQPLLPVVYDMELRGIAVDREKLRGLSEKYARRIGQLQSEADRIADMQVNLNSTKQLAFILYEKFNLDLSPEWRRKFKNKDGYSTSEEALLAIKGASPLIPVILEYREISKLKSTFADPIYEASAVDGRVHTSFDQLGTATGRFSSSKPNLQNIPTRSAMGQEIRECFVAPEGYVLLSSDYSQIDLRVLAHLSGDRNFTEAFRNGEDIHLRTASEIFNFAPEMVTKEMRRSAKAINFGIVYGQTPKGLSDELGITMSEAKKYISHYFEVCPGIKEWTESTVRQAKENGYVSTFAGRRRMLPELSSPNHKIRMFGERAAGNMPVQGGSAEIIKKAMLNAAKAFHGSKDVRMLLQIHDELIFEVKKEVLQEAARGIRTIMENAYTLSVPLVVEVKCGQNWKDMERLVIS